MHLLPPLVLLALPVVAADPHHNVGTLLSGEDIRFLIRSDEWQTHLQADQDPMKTPAMFHPSGYVRGTNLRGGGGLYGRWSVNGDQLCLRWDSSTAHHTEGCYRVRRLSSSDYDLIDPVSGQLRWHLVFDDN